MNTETLVKNLELKKGDFFTVVRWISQNDNSWRGDCFEAMVVDHPYVRAKNHDGWFEDRNITLNLDAVEIMPLSKEFVADVLQQKEERKTRSAGMKAQ